MVTIELPPEVAADAGPYAAQRPGRPLLTHQQDWRLQGLVKHLVDPTVVAETAGLLEQQTADIHAAFQPRNAWQDWVTGTIATIILRINRCERIERKLRDLASYRAIDFWEDDQALAVETVALKIGKEPAKTVARLRETPAGIDWLLAALADPRPGRAARLDRRPARPGDRAWSAATRRPTRRATGSSRERIAELEGHRDAGRRGRRDHPRPGRGGPQRRPGPGPGDAPAVHPVVAAAAQVVRRPVPRRAPRPLGRPPPAAGERRPGRRGVSRPEPEPLRGQGVLGRRDRRRPGDRRREIPNEPDGGVGGAGKMANKAIQPRRRGRRRRARASRSPPTSLRRSSTTTPPSRGGTTAAPSGRGNGRGNTPGGSERPGGGRIST